MLLRDTRLLPYWIIALFFVGWVAFFAFSSPIFGGVDTFIFRDPGCNLASHLGFVSMSVPDESAAIPPQLFADYTPGAPLLFAPAAAIFGCSNYTDTYYNLVLLTLIALLAMWFMPAGPEHRRRRVLAALLLGVTLPGGLYFTDLDRPEAIATVLLFLLLAGWRSTSGVWTKGVLAGLSGVLFLVHPYLGIVSFLVFWFLLLCQREQGGRLAIAGISLVVAVAVVLAWIGVLNWADPTAFPRFLEHAMGANSGAGVVLKGGSGAPAHAGPMRGYMVAVGKYLRSGTPLLGLPIVALLINFLLVGLAAARTGRQSAALPPLLVCAVLFCILFVFPALIFPSQPNYFAASGAVLFALVAVGGYPFSQQLRQGSLPLVLLLVAAVFSAPALTLRTLNSVDTRTSYRHAVAQAARVRQEFSARGEMQPRLITDAEHYFLYKPMFEHLYDVGYFSGASHAEAIDGFVHCYTGQAAFTRAQMRWPNFLDRNRWELIDGDSEVNLITLFGHRLQRRNWSWSCDVYARR